MVKFKLTGTYRGRHAFNAEIDRGNGVIEKHKIHLEGGKIINSEELDITVDGKRLKINHDELVEQLYKIKKASPSFVTFLKEPKKPSE